VTWLLLRISVPDSQEPTTEQVLLLRDDLKCQGERGQNEKVKEMGKRGKGDGEKKGRGPGGRGRNTPSRFTL